MRTAIAILLAAMTASAQSAIRDPQSAIPGRVVTFDLMATDARGRIVADLKPADFDIREDTTPLTLEAVRPVQAASPDESRFFAIFLDEYHVAGGTNADRVRTTLLQFVDRELGPRDWIAVMKPLDSLFAIKLTRDRAAARAIIDTFTGRQGDYSVKNAYERDYIAGTPARIEAARNQVALSAINALAVHLGSLSDRRKTLIVATEGVGGSERRRGMEYLPTLDTIVRAATRANVAIYPFDPGDAAGDPPPVAALRRLAGD